MKVKIYPSTVKGSIQIPPSKSMSHRAIICASLANGTSIIKNIAYSNDVKITIEGMRKLGANITCYEDSILIKGISDFSSLQTNEIFCNESGSTLRFFIPIFSLCNKELAFTGKNRLLLRPQKIYEEIFTSQGLVYSHDHERIAICGSLKPGYYELAGDVSSQFISGLLFALPLLKEDSTIHIKEPYESRSYVDLTLQMLHHYGIEVEYKDQNTLYIKGNQHYQANDYEVEGDYSQFAFFATLAAINNDLTCLGLSHDSLQGDKQIISILKAYGCCIETIENGYKIYKSQLHANEINLQNCPDLGPILTVLGMYAQGKTHIYNAQRLRYKESDRIEAMESELHKLDVAISSSEGDIWIDGKEHYTCSDKLFGHKDHRIVMSLCVASTLLDAPVIIEGAEAINKSYPTFFEDAKTIGVKVECYYD